MKIAAIVGVQPSVALDCHHPDNEAHAQHSSTEYEYANERAAAAELEDGVSEDLPLATSGALGTQLNLLV